MCLWLGRGETAQVVSVLPYDLHRDRLTRDQAAELANVSPEVIRKWVTRGYRDPADGVWKHLDTFPRDDGRDGYLGIDVLRAEAATRARARRVVAFPAGRVHSVRGVVCPTRGGAVR
jgi:hypothetical protein